MEFIRSALIIILIPIYFIVSIFISSLLTKITGVWDYYFIAISLPIIALVSTWFVSPYYKTLSVFGILITGMILARILVFPAYYPEGHEMAYMSTYTPFIITMVTGLIVTVVMLCYENKNDKKL